MVNRKDMCKVGLLVSNALHVSLKFKEVKFGESHECILSILILDSHSQPNRLNAG